MLDYIKLEVDAAYDRRRDQLEQDLAQIQITETFSSSTPPWEWLAEVDKFEKEQKDLLFQEWLNAHPIEDDFCLDDMAFLADHEIARDKRERRIAATDRIAKRLKAKADKHGNKPWQHGKKKSRDHRVIWSDTARKERERRNGKPAREDIAERLADMTADEPEFYQPQTGFILGQTPFLNPATKAKRRQQKLAKRLRGLKEYSHYLRYWPGKYWGIFLWETADEEIISISARLR